jgi:hypothetical protein
MLRRRFNRSRESELKSAPPEDFAKLVSTFLDRESENNGKKSTPKYLEMA